LHGSRGGWDSFSAAAFWTAEEKRRIVEQTLSSDVSVASIAREHGVNANQVFYWRKLYRAGQLAASEQSNEVRFLPVSVAEDGQHPKHLTRAPAAARA
jgi:transposase